jgi:hypothetical protein
MLSNEEKHQHPKWIPQQVEAKVAASSWGHRMAVGCWAGAGRIAGFNTTALTKSSYCKKKEGDLNWPGKAQINWLDLNSVFCHQ